MNRSPVGSRTGVLRVGLTAILALSLGATIGAPLLAPTTASAATTADAGSSVTVKWRGGNDPAIQQYQPDHAALSDGNGNDGGSGHWDDFKDLQITVSQTRGLGDQAIEITAKGMAPTVSPSQSARLSYLQAMQCWGDPSDPAFRETCQWGGYTQQEAGIDPDSPEGKNGVEILIGGGAALRGGIPFRSVAGQKNEPIPILSVDGKVKWISAGIQRFYSSTTTNELPFIPVLPGALGAQARFVTQSAAAQPYLGCGDPDSAAGERCWLVIVPRGSHSNTPASGQPCWNSDPSYGQPNPWEQKGSPLSPQCSIWDDRIVVPLDFEDPFLSCPPGAKERRIVGTEFVSDALSSWQPRLCASGSTYSLTTTAGDSVRAQLISGQAPFAAISAPITAESIGLEDPALLDQVDLRYAPLMNTSLTIGYLAEQRAGGVVNALKLTPRLIAKLLTQSYASFVPSGGEGPSDSLSISQLKWSTLFEDPEWVALGNPTDFHSNLSAGSWVVSGPQGDDAIRLLWSYVLADADAVAFLHGSPDPWGSTVNPYYLPPDDSRSVGGGLDLLSGPIDTFPKADQSLYPNAALAASKRGLQVGSDTYSPYATSFDANALRIVRADTQLTKYWDPNKFSGANVGFWVSQGPQLPGVPIAGRFAFGTTTASASENYQLRTAELSLPLRARTTDATVATARTFVAYSDAAAAAAVAAQTTNADGFASSDMSALPSNAYPLTSTVYAAVDLNAIGQDPAATGDYAALLDYSTAAGNEPGNPRGGLPEGYAPLTEKQIAASRTLAEALRAASAVTPPADEGAPVAGAGVPPAPAGAPAVVAATTDGSPPANATEMAALAAADAQNTSAVSSGFQGALGAGLIAGLAGVLLAPFLLVRRRPT